MDLDNFVAWGEEAKSKALSYLPRVYAKNQNLGPLVPLAKLAEFYTMVFHQIGSACLVLVQPYVNTRCPVLMQRLLCCVWVVTSGG